MMPYKIVAPVAKHSGNKINEQAQKNNHAGEAGEFRRRHPAPERNQRAGNLFARFVVLQFVRFRFITVAVDVIKLGF